MIFDLLEHEGLCLGGSSGINIAGAVRLAKELGPGHIVVTILADYGTRYQSKLFNPEFLREKKLPVPAWLERKSNIAIPFEKEPECDNTIEPPRAAGVGVENSSTERAIAMADNLPSKWLVSTEWLAERLGKPDVSIVDGSFYLPALKRNAKEEYLAGHIPGAVFFDIDAVADHSTDLPHMLPGTTMFAAEAGKLGIADTDTIVAYDGQGSSGAARAWWTFRIFGAKNVYILDGGMPKWKAEGRPTESGAAKRAAKTFAAELNSRVVAGVDDITLALMNRSAQVVDARPADRFRGEAPEPRAGIRSGHMPGAFNVPVTGLVENGRLIAPDKISREVQGRRRRPRQARHHHVWLWCHRGDAVVRARRHRQDAAGALRRLVDRMGRPA